MGKLKTALINREEAKQMMIDFDFEPNAVLPTRTETPTQKYARAWVKYAHLNKLNPNTVRYNQAQHAFLSGIGMVLGEEMPTLLSLCLASGRDIASIVERNQPR
jgi:hypothetical protein